MSNLKITLSLFCLYGAISLVAAFPDIITETQARTGRSGRAYYGYNDYSMPVEHQYGLYPYSYVKGSGYNTNSNSGWYNAPTITASTQGPSRTDNLQSNQPDAATTSSYSDVGDAHERPAFTQSKGDDSPADDRNEFIDGLEHQSSNSKIINVVIGEADDSTAVSVRPMKPSFVQQVRKFLTHPLTSIVAIVIPAMFLLVPFLQFLSKVFFGAGQVYEVMTSFAQRAYRNIDEDHVAWIIESIASFESEHLPKTSCIQHVLACDTPSIVANLSEEDAQLIGTVHKHIRKLVKRVTGNQGMIGKFLRPFVEGSCGNTECTKSDLQTTMKLFKNLSSKISSWTLQEKTE